MVDEMAARSFPGCRERPFPFQPAKAASPPLMPRAPLIRLFQRTATALYAQIASGITSPEIGCTRLRGGWVDIPFGLWPRFSLPCVPQCWLLSRIVTARTADRGPILYASVSSRARISHVPAAATPKACMIARCWLNIHVSGRPAPTRYLRPFCITLLWLMRSAPVMRSGMARFMFPITTQPACRGSLTSSSFTARSPLPVYVEKLRYHRHIAARQQNAFRLANPTT